MPHIKTIQQEIIAITRCSPEESHIIHMMLISRFGNLGGLKFSLFAHSARMAHMLVMLRNSKN